MLFCNYENQKQCENLSHVLNIQYVCDAVRSNFVCEFETGVVAMVTKVFVWSRNALGR